MGLAKGKRGSQKAGGAPQRQMGLAKGKLGCQKAGVGTKRQVGYQKANGVLKTLCHWLGMQSKAGIDGLLSSAGVWSKAGGDEASRQGW